MVLQDNYTEYARRTHKVLEHIDQHLDQSLELGTLAEVAHFSAFHFHRLFLAWMGETLGDYLRRRRLEVAAFRLIAQPKVPVLHIALSVGFGSAEAFARAFKSRFGCTATAWRQRRAAQREDIRANRSGFKSNPDQVISNPDQAHRRRWGDHETSRQPFLEVSMQVKIINRQPAKVAYLRHVGSYPYDQSVAKFWGETVCPWLAANDLLNQPRYGIGHDNPSITVAEKCRYDACVKVPPGFISTGTSFSTTLPGGNYAVTRFQGTAAEIGEAWGTLLRDWLPASGMQLDARPFFEYYSIDTTYNRKTGVFNCDLCVPRRCALRLRTS